VAENRVSHTSRDVIPCFFGLAQRERKAKYAIGMLFYFPTRRAQRDQKGHKQKTAEQRFMKNFDFKLLLHRGSLIAYFISGIFLCFCFEMKVGDA
jgi:hypothetical protein